MKSKGLKGIAKTTLFSVFFIVVGVFVYNYIIAISASGSPATILTTDFYGVPKNDFAPSELVYIHGSEFIPNSQIDITITRPDLVTESCNSISCHPRFLNGLQTSDENGNFIYRYNLDGIEGLYTVDATDGTSTAITTFTDANPAGNLDQCKNGGTGDTPLSPCEWVNGDLNENQAHFIEGQSVPYRITLTNIPISGTANCTAGGIDCELLIGYDVKNSGRNALDYVTHFQRIAETVNPCVGVSTCVPGNLFDVPVPASILVNGTPQPNTSFNNLPATERKIQIYNGQITDVSYVSQGNLLNANSETVIKIKFKADNSTVVIAWGGHIASLLDWGVGNSASGISGSPYHTRFKELCTPQFNEKKGIIELICGGGNQDRSLKSAAVSPPPRGEISGYKWNDTNGNGIKDIGENFLSGWNITIKGPVNSHQLTNSSGYYRFTGLYNGTYVISEILQNGWTQTYPASKNYTVDLICNGTSCVNLTDKNFGNRLKTCDFYTADTTCKANNCTWCPQCGWIGRPTKTNIWHQDTCVPKGTNCGWHCEIGICDATCSANTDCPCPKDYCDGRTYVDYPGYGTCKDCTQSCYCNVSTTPGQPCAPALYPNDPRCGECTIDDDCNKLDKDYCDGTVIKHDEGRCVNYSCQVETTPVQDCNDGLYCNGQETCENAQCIQGTTIDCSGLNSECQEGKCDESLDQCVPDYTSFPLSTPCQSDDVCKVNHCDGFGSCVLNYNVNCDDDNKCTNDFCDPVLGCQHETIICDDGVGCTENSCDPEIGCVYTPNDNKCPSDTKCADYYCDVNLDCQVNYSKLSTPCEADGNLCTFDHCDGLGSCVQFASRSCHSSTECEKSYDCEPTTGECVYENMPLSTPCEADYKPCTIDHCDGLGSCVFWKDYDCNSYDGWYDTNKTQWVSTGECTEKEQKEQGYRDYSCSEDSIERCIYIITNYQWLDTGNTRNKPDGTTCDDGLYCTDPDTCKSGVCGGSSRNCSKFDLKEIATCDWTPDNYHFTWDYSPGFKSICNETLDKCTEGSRTYNHTCADSDMFDTVPYGSGCDAECDEDVDCENYCKGDTRYFAGLCDFGDCFCNYDTENCDKDGCYAYETGCEDRDYYCKVEGCQFNYSNRNTDYNDEFVNYCYDSTIRKHRTLHDFFCDGTCLDHTNWVDDQLVEDCNLQDGWYNTTNYQWIDATQCTEKEQIQQEYRDFTCSEPASCQYKVTKYQWVDTGNIKYKELSTSCDNGVYCDGEDHCDGLGSCVPKGSSIDCNYLSDQCNLGFCNEDNDRCEYAPKETSHPCDDGIWCNGPDHCDATDAGGLIPAVCVNLGPSIDCSNLNDQCQEGICDESLDQCVPDYTKYPWSTPCEADDDKCTLDHCDGKGSCIFENNVPVPPAEDCKSFYCDPSDGKIKEDYTNFPLSTPCELDDNKCTIDHCDGSGSCVFWKNVPIPSKPIKIIGKPKIKCQENEWCEWRITTITPINLTCEIGNVKWRYALDGDWKDWNTDGSSITIFFPEESNHTLEVKCINDCYEGELDTEKFKVEGRAFEIPLLKKWNLISIPFALLNGSVSEAFKSISNDIISVWAYDNKSWSSWSPDLGGTLTEIKPGWGYWILAKNNTKLLISGNLFSPITTPPNKNLQEGWNLIGYYGTEWQTYQIESDNCGYDYKYGNFVYCSLNSLVDTQEGNPRWSSMWGYDNCGNDKTYWNSLNTCDRMYAGKGYWIEMDVLDGYAPASNCIWGKEFKC